MTGGRTGLPVRVSLISLSLLFMTAWPGCHSAFVQMTIENRAASPVRLVEVDYPSASFGVGSVEAHARFHYRFKVQGSAPVKLTFTDAQGKLHESTGPVLNEGQEGAIDVIIQPDDGVSWQPSLAAPSR